MSLDREQGGQRSPVFHEATQILPSWSQQATIVDHVVAPSMKRQSSGDKKYARDKGDESKSEELRRAANQFSQVFGVKAG